jgi:hypothetical protein
MPEHLEEIKIGSLNVINDLSTYLTREGNNYVAASQPNLEKCVAEEVGEKIKPLYSTAIPKLYKTVRWIPVILKGMLIVG